MSALAAMLPRLQAEETLRLSSAVSLGSGTLRKEDASSFRADLLRAAEGDRPVRLSTPEERLSAAAALGISVVREAS